MTSHHQDMLNACTSGDIAALQRIFEAENIQNGSKPVYIFAPDGLPPTNEMLEVAITKGKSDIVFLLLETYTGINSSEWVITALLNHPDMAILRALYNYNQGIVQFEWDDRFRTFVTEACKQPPKKIAPLLHFLVEHDAALDVGGLPFDFAVHAAICGDQSLDVIEAMIKKGGPVTKAAAQQAVLRERVDVIQSFIRFGVQTKHDDVQDLRTTAEETGNGEVAELVKMWTSSWAGDTSRAELSSRVAQKLKQLLK